MKAFFNTITNLGRLLFDKNPVSHLVELRIKLAMTILPKDLRSFFVVVVSEVESKYQKLDKSKKDKISGLRVDFEFRD